MVVCTQPPRTERVQANGRNRKIWRYRERAYGRHSLVTTYLCLWWRVRMSTDEYGAVSPPSHAATATFTILMRFSVPIRKNPYLSVCGDRYFRRSSAYATVFPPLWQFSAPNPFRVFRFGSALAAPQTTTRPRSFDCRAAVIRAQKTGCRRISGSATARSVFGRKARNYFCSSAFSSALASALDSSAGFSSAFFSAFGALAAAFFSGAPASTSMMMHISAASPRRCASFRMRV